MQFKLFTAIALLVVAGVSAAPNPEPAPQAGTVICPGSGDVCPTNGFRCCGVIPSIQYCLPVGTKC